MNNALRLDKYLAEKKYFESREKATQAILSGHVKVNDAVITQTSFTIRENDIIEVTPGAIKFVSKGGHKLEKALNFFDIQLKDKIVVDVGASTGGFTDCALQYGAAKIFAIDVGTLQLHPSLLSHPQVISKENTDIRNITIADIDNKPADVILADLSFIGLAKVLPVFSLLVKEKGDLLLLVKPQFETESKKKFKRGIVKDHQIRKDALDKVISAATEAGFQYVNAIETDADGRYKNIEYMVLFRKS